MVEQTADCCCMQAAPTEAKTSCSTALTPSPQPPAAPTRSKPSCSTALAPSPLTLPDSSPKQPSSPSDYIAVIHAPTARC